MSGLRKNLLTQEYQSDIEDFSDDELEELQKPLPLVRSNAVRNEEFLKKLDQFTAPTRTSGFSDEEIRKAEEKKPGSSRWMQNANADHMDLTHTLGFKPVKCMHTRGMKKYPGKRTVPETPPPVAEALPVPVVSAIKRAKTPNPDHPMMKKIWELENANKKLEAKYQQSEKEHDELRRLYLRRDNERNTFYQKLLNMGAFDNMSVDDMVRLALPQEITVRDLQTENRDLRLQCKELRKLTDELVSELDNTRKRKLPDFTVETKVDTTVTIDLTDDDEDPKGKRQCFSV